jgi:hypothetical protein
MPARSPTFWPPTVAVNELVPLFRNILFVEPLPPRAAMMSRSPSLSTSATMMPAEAVWLIETFEVAPAMFVNVRPPSFLKKKPGVASPKMKSGRPFLTMSATTPNRIDETGLENKLRLANEVPVVLRRTAGLALTESVATKSILPSVSRSAQNPARRFAETVAPLDAVTLVNVITPFGMNSLRSNCTPDVLRHRRSRSPSLS